MGIRDPVMAAMTWFRTSSSGAGNLIEAIKGKTEFSLADHVINLKESRLDGRSCLDRLERERFEEVFRDLGTREKRAVLRGVEGKISNWLNVIPLYEHQFDLSPVEFRDAISLRYGRQLLGLPAYCDGCGDNFSIQHALDCKKGGLVIQRHNEIRDSLGEVCAMVFSEVVREPVVREADEEN